MRWWEVQRYINGIRRADRPLWESIRQLGFWVLSALGSKVNTATDICEFPWERKRNASITEQEIADALALIRAENEKSS